MVAIVARRRGQLDHGRAAIASDGGDGHGFGLRMKRADGHFACLPRGNVSPLGLRHATRPTTRISAPAGIRVDTRPSTGAMKTTVFPKARPATPSRPHDNNEMPWKNGGFTWALGGHDSRSASHPAG